ncbi:hypothetical protein [Oceanicoccus sp. KOV_DT_Chl]|uniref:hypothetical protein n=1 Tax=Oceanicoccus sp. KOV_DT_Chl TaxID=1904639 RepID=UPI00190E6403|nr:hypothetical protein [Oceanicoccus sp. KOV_DT_Chl]
MFYRLYFAQRFIFCLLMFTPVLVIADGSGIDKIYHPYVELLEWEVEWRGTQENRNPESNETRLQQQKLGIGKALADRLFVEAYFIGEGSSDESLALSAYELELLLQLSEQGEYFADYGLLIELEKKDALNIWELATQFLLEKELGKFSATANIGLIYEWGNDIEDEWETSLALQLRYRQSPRFEPALELYIAEDTQAIGPVLLGMEKLGSGKALRWEVGTIFGLSQETADYTLRAALEYEF